MTFDKSISVAPMMAWTDRHCRYLHRLYSPAILLFTEMVTTGALLRGGQWHQLDYSAEEHPIVLQLGGNDPADLARCAAEAARRGFDEINLNVGCPSDRVQQGTFGACLMLTPKIVAQCVSAMRAACDIPISVKCRLGVDDQDSDPLLQAFIDEVADGGCERFYIHARKAILGGLSPAQNRSVPPLQPERVARLKRNRPNLNVVINGGITDPTTAEDYLTWADGVMIGRAAYHNPELLRTLHQRFVDPTFNPSTQSIVLAYRTYISEQLQMGIRLSAMSKHLLHACSGMPGARRFRQILSDSKRLKENNIGLIDEAIDHIYARAA